jgi:xanthosine utilization system XapX-like protein
MTTLPVDLSVTRITRAALVLGVAGVLITWAIAGPRDAAGFLVGALMSLITIRSWFKLAGDLGSDGSVPGGGAAIFLVLRYVLIAGAIYATIKVLKSSPAVLIVGLLVSFAAVLLDLLFGLMAPKKVSK